MSLKHEKICKIILLFKYLCVCGCLNIVCILTMIEVKILEQGWAEYGPWAGSSLNWPICQNVKWTCFHFFKNSVQVNFIEI